MKKRFLVSATSDLITDQRVDRTACTIKDMGHDVLVIGRKLKNSPSMTGRRYRTVRFHLWFERGPLFYASYNIRLFIFLMRNKADVFFSNDLDTLPANYLASKLKGIQLVYDSHEYFTGVPELEGRPLVQKFWKWIEQKIIPKLKLAITVNESIAKLYEKEYGTHFAIVRNMPFSSTEDLRSKKLLRHDLGLPQEQKIVILQGAGINIHRGSEEAVEAMQYLENTLLLIVGSGDIVPQLKIYVKEHQLEEKVRFIPRQTARILRRYTHAADLGLSLDKSNNINYQFSLPNKLFDYIQAQIPVLASDLPEIRKIIDEYRVGRLCASHDPKIMANTIREMLISIEQDENLKANLVRAANELNWENEQQHLKEVLRKLGR